MVEAQSEIRTARRHLEVSASILSATSRLFSSTVIRDLAGKGRSPLFARLVAEAGLLERRRPHETVGHVFEAAFAMLRRGARRDEYVYKAALTHKVLLGKHSLRTACMLNEFRVGPCKADVVILNGTATVYEIKSERDSLSRLARQLDAYTAVFPSVVVIAGANHVPAVVETVTEDVGVLRLSDRHTISVVKPAIDRPDRICPQSVFESLRMVEAKAVLSLLGVKCPDVPNTQLHAALREYFVGLEPTRVHQAMVQVLKHKRDLRPLGELIGRLPASLQPAALTVPIRRADHDRLVRAVNTPFVEALAWA